MQKFLFVLIALLPFLAQAQVLDQQKVKTNIDQNGNYFPQERVYMQFDKPAYAPGETIWYKAYLMMGTEPSFISTNYYVDITDPNGNVLKHYIMPIVEASAKGSFDIPTTYTGKTVHVHGYTRWMMNFDTAFLYERDIRVVQLKPAANNITPATYKPVIQFFPEGGDAVMGINNKVAFKAIYPTGKPCAVKGNIINNKGKVVADLITQHDGMGAFMLEPVAGETYTAKWKDESGAAFETALPAAKTQGVTLEIKVVKDKVGFLIKRNETAPDKFKKLNVVATMQQHLVYMAGVKLDVAPIIGGSIPTADLASGILQVTLFDSNWVAVAERIVFVNNNDYLLEPEVGFAAINLNKRGKNTLVISMPDLQQANLSVSITDAGLGIDSSDDIISHLLLTGDLKGRVYKPSYYFSDTTDTIQQHLDLVMLTNGWRRIKWDEVIAGKMPVIKYPNDTAYLSLSGKVFGATSSDLSTGGLLLMILDKGKDSARKTIQSFLKKDGTFSEPNLIMFDTTKVYYRIAGSQNLADKTEVAFNVGMPPSTRPIFFDKNGALYFMDSATEYRLRYFALEQARLAKLAEGATLAAVTVKAKTKSKLEILDDTYTSGLFSGGNATQFDIANDPSSRAAQNILTYLQGRVAGLQINASSTVGGTNGVTWRGGTPSFFLDEMPVDISQLTSMNMSTVAYIKVFQPPFFGSFGGGANGAIAVYTQRGSSQQNNGPSRSLPYKQIIGYTGQKEFYSPNYGSFDQRNDEEDLRSTLYWNPMILTTRENHIIKIPFYNNDITQGFRVIVEGVSKQGQLTRVVKLIE
ncbi:hypothetical protein [Limnovirga soli]|uniref:TonB-dependent receptor plug domain-containing protein n=1 Tax=Limnovirga soli TaxID=2656915 RepID=A0A8J8FAQ6_9BACT|nr:hypothetical protein [Limnovirga soli]NNV54600.1 TonB-dependent receptor plug domain-containing protein [Limnovirga soli]